MALVQDAEGNKGCLDVGVMPTGKWMCRHLLDRMKVTQHHCTSESNLL